MATKKKSILIVEDERAMIETLGKKFVKAGFRVFEAHNGEEGLAIAEKEQPDIAMLDIIMPKMDGMELMKKIREIGEWGRKVPIIMLTNLSDAEKVSEAAKYRVYDFLVKTDWRLDDVVGLVKSKLGI